MYFGVNLTPDHNLRIDSKLQLAFFTVKENRKRIWIPKNKYFCSIKLLDSKGLEIEKTKFGETIGTAFDEIDQGELSLINIIGVNTGGSPRYEMAFAYKVGNPANTRYLKMNGKNLILKDIFELENPGQYKLILRSMVFTKQSGSAIYDVIKFPEISINVVVD